MDISERHKPPEADKRTKSVNMLPRLVQNSALFEDERKYKGGGSTLTQNREPLRDGHISIVSYGVTTLLTVSQKD